MIDSVAILFSTIGILFVLRRAIQLDRRIPWFGEADGGAGQADGKKAAERQAGGRRCAR